MKRWKNVNSRWILVTNVTIIRTLMEYKLHQSTKMNFGIIKMIVTILSFIVTVIIVIVVKYWYRI